MVREDSWLILRSYSTHLSCLIRFDKICFVVVVDLLEMQPEILTNSLRTFMKLLIISVPLTLEASGGFISRVRMSHPRGSASQPKAACPCLSAFPNGQVPRSMPPWVLSHGAGQAVSAKRKVEARGSQMLGALWSGGDGGKFRRDRKIQLRFF